MEGSKEEFRVSERMLWLPTLIFIRESQGIKTAEFIDKLEKLLRPTGKDAEKPKRRNDSYFSQIARNVKSHNSLKMLTDYSSSGGWKLNAVGHALLSTNEEIVSDIKDIIEDITFSYSDKLVLLNAIAGQVFPISKEIIDRKLIIKDKRESVDGTEVHEEVNEYEKNTPVVRKSFIYNENEVITNEGSESIRSITVRRRSTKLRNAAIEHYKDKDGHIRCSICNFEFSKVYDGLGEDYIEIHHKKPIYQYEDEDEEVVISNALNNLVPVCANCHRMLHRRSNISYDEVVKIYNENKK